MKIKIKSHFERGTQPFLLFHLIEKAVETSSAKQKMLQKTNVT